MSKETEEKPIVVNMAEGQHELVILQGNAPAKLDELKPIKLDIEGTIESPLAFLHKRVGDIDQHKAHIIVNRDNLTIALVYNESDPYNIGRIIGGMSFSNIFLQLGINQNKKWEPEQLGQFLKLNRVYFENREENMVVVNALKSFNAKVNQTIEKESRENGNRAYTFRQAVDSNIPPMFKLRIPVLSGSEPVEIEVETYAYVDGSSVLVSLQSAGANDIVEDVRNSYIDGVVNEIKNVAPEIVIIEQ